MILYACLKGLVVTVQTAGNSGPFYVTKEGRVLEANAEAATAGLRPGLPAWHAQRLCPDAQVIPFDQPWWPPWPNASIQPAGLSRRTLEAVLTAREAGRFADLADFCRRGSV